MKLKKEHGLVIGAIIAALIGVMIPTTILPTLWLAGLLALLGIVAGLMPDKSSLMNKVSVLGTVVVGVAFSQILPFGSLVNVFFLQVAIFAGAFFLVDVIKGKRKL